MTDIRNTAALSELPGLVWPAIIDPRSAAIHAVAWQLEQSQWWSPERLVGRQLEQARHLLDHAQAQVPFHRRRLKPFAGLPEGALTMERWREIPIMTRAELQASERAILARVLPKDHGTPVETRSSGSTGRPVVARATAVTAILGHGLEHRERRWHRHDLAAKQVAIRIPHVGHAEDQAPTGWLPGYATGPHVVVSLRLPVDQQLDRLVAEAPGHLVSYPSNLAALAEIAITRGIGLPSLRTIGAFGEVVTARQRALCRRAFGLDLIDVYSAQEIGAMATQCPDVPEHLHVHAEAVLLEVLDPAGRPVSAGDIGRVVVTVLHNLASPLIRYEIGDHAELGPACACGRGLPTLRRVAGRQRNMLVLPDGGTVWPMFLSDHLSLFAPIRQFQLVQTGATRIEARIIADRDLTAAEIATLREKMGARLGFPFTIDFLRVGAIERGSGGKYEDFRCALPPAAEAP